MLICQSALQCMLNSVATIEGIKNNDINLSETVYPISDRLKSLFFIPNSLFFLLWLHLNRTSHVYTHRNDLFPSIRDITLYHICLFILLYIFLYLTVNLILQSCNTKY